MTNPQIPEEMGFDPSCYAVGQRFWMQGARNYNRSHEVVITDVGRKWAKFADAESGREAGRVEIGECNVDGGNYSSPGRLYRDREHFAIERAANDLWLVLRCALVSVRPRHMTQQRIEQVLSILRDSNDSAAIAQKDRS